MVCVCVCVCRGVVDDGGFHSACACVQQDSVPFFRQFSLHSPDPRSPSPHDCLSAAELTSPDSHVSSAHSDMPTVSWTFALCLSVCLSVLVHLSVRYAAI